MKNLIKKIDISKLIYDLAIIVFLIIAVYTFISNDKQYYKEIIEFNPTTNQELEKINIEKDDLKKIKITYENNNDDIEDIFTLKIKDKSNKTVGSKNIKVHGLTDSIEINDKNTKDKEFTFETLNLIKITKLELNYSSKYNKFIFIIVTIIFTALAFLAKYFIFKNNLKIEKIYLIFAFIIYGFFVFLMPMYIAHDELYHWYRAYEVSTGGLITKMGNGSVGANLPVALEKSSRKSQYGITYKSTLDGIHEKITDEKKFMDMETVALYSPVQYLPQATGIIVGRIFTDSAIIIAYFGRIFNALVSILIMYTAIKIIPFGKKILFSISFLPIAVEGFTSLSPDAMTISISMLIIAYILNITYTKNIKVMTKKEYLILTILYAIIALCKIVYVPLLLLCLLIPKEKYKSKKEQIIFLSLIFFITLSLNLGWLSVASKYLSVYEDATNQTTSILSNPLKYIGVMIYTFCVNFKNYLYGMVGDGLVWGEEVKLITIIPTTNIALLLGLALFDKESKYKGKIKDNIIFGLTSFIILGLIFTSLYVQWSHPGKIAIEGIQGRYFIPFLPLILLLISNIKVKYTGKENIEKLMLCTISILTYSTMLSLLVHFISL